MEELFDTRTVERQQFFNGQPLFDVDLQFLADQHRELRRIHNQNLHQSGIGNGYPIVGQKGASSVSVGPGYALDGEGNEIILLEERIEPVPPVAAETNGEPVFFDLAISYPTDDELEVLETRAGICHPRGAVRLQEEPTFCWVRLVRMESGRLEVQDGQLRIDIQRGAKIIIGRISVLNCQLNELVDTSVRRSARPPQQPVIRCGISAPEWEVVWAIDRELIKAQIQTFLQAAEIPISDNRDQLLRSLADLGRGGPGAFITLTPPFVLRTEVDTSKAGFATPPHYQARIEGSRLHGIEVEFEEEDDGTETGGTPIG